MSPPCRPKPVIPMPFPSVKVYGGVPPEGISVAVYGVPVRMLGSTPGRRLSAETFSPRLILRVWLAESVTTNLTVLLLTAVVGTPPI